MEHNKLKCGQAASRAFGLSDTRMETLRAGDLIKLSYNKMMS